MAQGPIQVKQTPSTGGNTPTYSLTAAGVIKALPGRLCRIIFNSLGSTGGSFVFNDCATVAAASSTGATANQICSIAFNASNVVVGIPIVYDWPCNTGLVLSAVPTGGSPSVNVAYD